jgi:hypothetical protein
VHRARQQHAQRHAHHARGHKPALAPGAEGTAPTVRLPANAPALDGRLKQPERQHFLDHRDPRCRRGLKAIKRHHRD